MNYPNPTGSDYESLGPTGPSHCPRGARGPYGGTSEADIVRHLISDLRAAQNTEGALDDDCNSYHAVNFFVLWQSVWVLEHYLTLLTEPLDKRVPGYFWDVGAPAEKDNCI